MIGFSSRARLRGIEYLSAHLERDAQEAVDKAALMIEARAKPFAPVDTGALRNSIYSVTSRSNGAAGAASSAQATNPDATLAPSLGRPKRFEAFVASAVKYALYVEMGAKGRGGSWFMRRAMRTVAPWFNRRIRQILQRGGLR